MQTESDPSEVEQGDVMTRLACTLRDLLCGFVSENASPEGCFLESLFA
jgi:hypothetical protein